MGYSKVVNAAKQEVTLEMVESLFSFLQGDDVEGITVGRKTKAETRECLLRYLFPSGTTKPSSRLL